MSKKTVKVSATFIYELEVDTESSYVKDYDNEEGMIEDLVQEFQNLNFKTMSKKKVKVSATFSYVKDYDNEEGMIEDLVHYRFTTLPVIGKGVEIKDVEVDTYEVF